MLQNVQLNGLAVLVSTALLAACGDATTNIIEKEPIVIEHPVPPVTSAGKGRLLVTDKNSGQVSVYNLDNYELLRQLQLVYTPEYAYASPGQRYGMLLHRSKDLVEVVDGGLWQEDHGDHLHPYAEDPRLMKFRLTGSRPTHVQGNSSQLAIFNDGDAASNTPASVVVVTEAQIEGDKTDFPTLSYHTHMHGAAQPRGDYLVSTIRDAASATTLPDTVGIYQQAAGKYELKQTLDTQCPGLHGSAQNKEFVSFGCSDGVLWIAQNGSSFSHGKIGHTADFTGTARVGTVEGHPAAAHFIGLAGAMVVAVDPLAKTLHKVDWQAPASASIVGYGFSHDGKRFVLLDNQGNLSVLSYDASKAAGSNFTLAGKVQVATDLAAMPAGSALQLTLSGSDERAYVLNPVSKAVAVVDLTKLQLTSTLQLSYTPHKLVWLGIAG